MRSVEVLQLLLPGLGAQVEDVAGRMSADEGKHVAEVLPRVEPVELARLDERVENAGALGAAVVRGEEPILAADSDRPQTPLGGIVVELEAGVLQEASERVPLVADVADGLGESVGK